MCTIHVIRWLLIVLRIYGSFLSQCDCCAVQKKIPTEMKDWRESAACRMINSNNFQDAIIIYFSGKLIIFLCCLRAGRSMVLAVNCARNDKHFTDIKLTTRFHCSLSITSEADIKEVETLKTRSLQKLLIDTDLRQDVVLCHILCSTHKKKTRFQFIVVGFPFSYVNFTLYFWKRCLMCVTLAWLRTRQ